VSAAFVTMPYAFVPPREQDIAPTCFLITTSAGTLVARVAGRAEPVIRDLALGVMFLAGVSYIDPSTTCDLLAVSADASGAQSLVPITPSDTTDQILGPFIGLLAETDGQVNFLVGDSGRLPISLAVVAGERVDVPVARVEAAGTTAIVKGRLPYALVPSYAVLPRRGVDVGPFVSLIATSAGELVVEFVGIDAPQFARLATGDQLLGPPVRRIAPRSSASVLGVPPPVGEPSQRLVHLTKSDSTPDPNGPFSQLLSFDAGTVRYTDTNGSTSTSTVVASELVLASVSRVWNTGTTADVIGVIT
jgi:hypothetical protein